MKRLVVQRGISDEQGTLGYGTLAGFHTFTLELPWHDNRRSVSCIPAGVYTCVVVRSPRFGRVYSVLDVPARGDILLHNGNFAGDENLGWQTHSHGCILLGLKRGVLTNSYGKAQRAVLVSRPAVSALADFMQNQPFELELVNAYVHS